MDKHQISAKAVFDEAVEIESPQEREAYLDEACVEDRGLRQKVNGLLKAHKEAGSFLKSPPPGVDATIDSEIRESPGTIIGRYKLLQQVGEGGMGTVFMAEQREPVRRKVALKIIKPGMDTKEVIARFEAERQALAMMDHPNIAKVLDAGATESGRPYFVMDLVRGVPITDFCDANDLTPRERLDLFVSVCQAVQHAHQKGIIHRDIKPSNVLVTADDTGPEVKVIDFGIAKATGCELTEKTLFTRFDQIVGTPIYMSPEQTEMRTRGVDTRSDIYSLGVLLYELLTGTTPFDRDRLHSAVHEEILRIIREEEPPKPSTRISTLGESASVVARHRKTEPGKLTALVRGDLDWIVMKALEKDRSRRYDTAKGLADDVLRHVNDEPVEARPPSAWYRFQKYSRRHRGFVVSAAAITIMLALVIAGISTGYVVAHATLTKLQDALLDRAFLLAFTGDLEGVQQVLKDARLAGLDEQWQSTLEGAAYLFHGDEKSAMELLQEASKDESNVSALALLAVAYIRAGEWSSFERLYPKLQNLRPRAAYQDYDEFLLTHVLGDHDSTSAVERMESLVAKQPSWILPRVLINYTRLGAAQQTRDLKQLEEALDFSRSLRTLYHENRFVLQCRFETLVTALEHYQRHDLEISPELKDEAFEAAESLADYNLADRILPHFLDLAGELEKAHIAWTKAAQSGSPAMAFEAAGFFYRNDDEDDDAWMTVRTCHQDRAEMQIARAYMLLNSPAEREQAMSLAESAVESCPTWWIRQMASKVFLLLGENERAEKLCRNWVRSDQESALQCPWIW